MGFLLNFPLLSYSFVTNLPTCVRFMYRNNPLASYSAVASDVESSIEVFNGCKNDSASTAATYFIGPLYD